MTETIDRLYLELSNISTATTSRELTARKWLKRARVALEQQTIDREKLIEFIDTAMFCLRDRFNEPTDAGQPAGSE